MIFFLNLKNIQQNSFDKKRILTRLHMTLFLCSMHCDVEQGLVYFILFKASHLVKAYEKAREIMVSRVIIMLP